jgi:hypothetical protein
MANEGAKAIQVLDGEILDDVTRQYAKDVFTRMVRAAPESLLRMLARDREGC